MASHQPGLQARQWAGVPLPVEHDSIRNVLLHLFRFGERNHHLRERGSQSLHYIAKEDRVPHLDPRLGPAHAPAVAPGEHQQSRFHEDKSRCEGD